MDKDIIEHYRFVSSKLKEEDLNATEISSLETFNEQRIRDFQHERLIHLLVTFFFGFLLLFFAVGYFIALSMFTFGLLHWLLLAAVTLLLVVELFYIFHYYKLENGTQKLYSLRSTLLQYQNRTK